MGLVAVNQDSIMAEQASSEGVINICKEYRRYVLFIFTGFVLCPAGTHYAAC